MKLLTFEQWHDSELKERTDGFIVQCRHCKGSGEAECDCDCPHCEHTSDCGHCDGSGQLTWGDIGIAEQGNYLGQAGYKAAIRQDIEFLSKRLGRPLEQIALENGIGSLCRYRNDRKPDWQDVEVRFVFEAQNYMQNELQGAWF